MSLLLNNMFSKYFSVYLCMDSWLCAFNCYSNVAWVASGIKVK